MFLLFFFQIATTTTNKCKKTQFYGAVAAAAGFNDGQILKAAGFVQKWFGDTEGDGGTVNIINGLLECISTSGIRREKKKLR